MSNNIYNWPNFQTSKPIDKEGNWTPEWQIIMQNFFTYAQTNFSNEGHRLPQQTDVNINQLVTNIPNPTNVVPDGTMFYNTDAQSFQVKINGALKTVTVS